MLYLVLNSFYPLFFIVSYDIKLFYSANTQERRIVFVV